MGRGESIPNDRQPTSGHDLILWRSDIEQPDSPVEIVRLPRDHRPIEQFIPSSHASIVSGAPRPLAWPSQLQRASRRRRRRNWRIIFAPSQPPTRASTRERGG